MGYYGYVTYYNTNVSKPTDIANTSPINSEILVQIFTVDWCPHCKTAKPEWASFCNEYDNTIIKNYTIRCDSNGIDCTNDKDPDIAALLAKNDIKGYPTVILFKDGKKYDFDAKISKHTLSQFVNSVAND